MSVSRRCGWCGRSTVAVEAASCASCGGPLPPLPRAVLRKDPALADGDASFLAARPPPPPRWIPFRYVRDQLLWGHIGGFIGPIFFGIFGLFGAIGCFAVFVLPPLGCMFLAFGAVSLVGLWLMGQSVLHARHALRPLRHGTPVEGVIVGVQLDTSRTEGGRHPWVLDFAWQVDGRTYDRSIAVFDDTVSVREAGEPTWVVYDPADPEHGDLWPPVR